MDVDSLDNNGMAEVNLDDAVMADAMDDLFGDAHEPLDLATGVHMPSLNVPLPPALRVRLADMQTIGCCTRLAWSNSGSIAKISRDGRTIDFFMYAVDATSGEWKLSGPSHNPITIAAPLHFVHIQFNLVGHELAAVDNLGHSHIYSQLGGIGRMQAGSIIAQEDEGQHTELDAVAGLHWLPIFPLDCRSLYIGPASRGLHGWASQSRPREPDAVKVHHPADNARALVFVTRRGVLTLQYQLDGWRTLTMNLDERAALISHADFCEYSGNLLLAIYDITLTLTLYQIGIAWNSTYASNANHTQQITGIDPRMQILRLTSTGDTSPRHLLGQKLTQIRVLPPTAEVVEADVVSPPTVLATFVQNGSNDDELEQFGHSATILIRWQVESDPRALDDSFRKMRPGSNTFNITVDKTVLRRQPDLITPKVILSVTPKYFDALVTLVTSDGTIEVRDRATFDILEPDMDTDHVSSLVQSGFAYHTVTHNVCAAVSNDGSAMASLGPDDILEVSHMTFQYGWQTTGGVSGPSTNQLAEAGIVCIARQYMIMTCSYTSPDEVLPLLPAPLPKELHRLLCQEAFRLTRHGPDISSFDERLRQGLAIREPLMPKAYGLQLAVGTSLASSSRSLTAQLAWTVLNLRHICFSVSQSMSRLDPTQPFPSGPIHSLRGLCRWGVDLIVMLLSALNSVVEKLDQDPSRSVVSSLQDYMKESGSPTFLLFLCSLPRTLLKLLAQFIPRLIKFSQISSSRARSVLERQQLTEIGMMEKTISFTFESFKTFLDNVETTMQSVSREASSSDSSVPSADTLMSLTGEIPDELDRSLRSLMATAVPSLLDAADLSKIFFADTSWLGLGGPASVKIAMRYDVLRKLPLREDEPVRKCRRCGSMMEELNVDKATEVTQWLVAAQRNCICTSNWSIP